MDTENINHKIITSSFKTPVKKELDYNSTNNNDNHHTQLLTPHIVSPSTPHQQELKFPTLSPVHKMELHAIKKTHEKKNSLAEEYKKAVEALSSQVDLLRKREDRYIKEIERMKSYKNKEKNDGAEEISAEKEILHSENHQLKDQVFNMERSVKLLLSDKEALLRQVIDAKQNMQSLSTAVSTLERNMGSKEKKLNYEIKQLNSLINTKEQQVSILQVNINQLLQENQRLSKVEGDKQKIENNLLKKTLEFDEAQKNVERLQNELKSQDQNSKKAFDEKISLLQKVDEEKNKTISQLEEELNKYKNELNEWKLKKSCIDEIIFKCSRVEEENEEKTHQITSLKEEISQLQSKTSARQNEIIMDALQKEVATMKESFRNQFETEREHMKQKLCDIEKSYKEAKERVVKYENMEIVFEKNQKEIIMLKKIINERNEDLNKLKKEREDSEEMKKTLEKSMKELFHDNEKERLKQTVEELRVTNGLLVVRCEVAKQQNNEIEHLRDCLEKERALLQQQKIKEVEYIQQIKEYEIEKEQSENLKNDQKKKFQEIQEIKKHFLLMENKMNEMEQCVKEKEKENMKLIRTVEEKEIQLNDFMVQKKRIEEEWIEKEIGLRDQLNLIKNEIKQYELKMNELQRYEKRIKELEFHIQQHQNEIKFKDEKNEFLEKKMEQLNVDNQKKYTEQIGNMMKRLECADQLNHELDERLVKMMSQSKKDQAEIMTLKGKNKQFRDIIKQDYFHKQLKRVQQIIQEKDQVCSAMKVDLLQYETTQKQSDAKIQYLSNELNQLTIRVRDYESLQNNQIQLKHQLVEKTNSIQKLQNAIIKMQRNYTFKSKEKNEEIQELIEQIQQQQANYNHLEKKLKIKTVDKMNSTIPTLMDEKDPLSATPPRNSSWTNMSDIDEMEYLLHRIETIK